MSNWKRYKNGNYVVDIDLENGTKIRHNNLDNLTPAFAENCDVKITDKCDGGCEFCYEGCSPNGRHAELLRLPFFDTLHPYTELAINGNDLSHPELLPFLEKLANKRIIANMTVNQKHFERSYELLKWLMDNKLIYGLGVSLREPTDRFINLIKKHSNIVVHTINGVTTLEDYKTLANNDLRVLVLGYKELRRGNDYYDRHKSQITQNQTELYDALGSIVDDKWFKVISFDNLAIEQLNVKRLLSDEEWDEFFMGLDSQYTFYLDLVEKKFSKNSIAPENERYDLLDNIDDMFNVVRHQQYKINV